MIYKTLVLIGFLGCNAAASNLRGDEINEVDTTLENLDLEIILENGDRELFPLLPGTKCPTGHKCSVRTHIGGMSPMANSLKANMKTPLAMTLDWKEFDTNMKTVVASDKFCTRRQAMTRAAGLAAGVAAATVAKPAYAAETKEVKMGSDSGLLAFVPSKMTICKGDSVKWVNNKGGPHNVVFDDDGIPEGVNQEAISMMDQMGEEDDTFTMTFDKAGDYAYYCEPHRGAGMQGQLIVT